MIDDFEPLSDQGRLRREQILILARSQASAMVQHRQRRNRALAVVVFSMIATAWILYETIQPTNRNITIDKKSSLDIKIIVPIPPTIAKSEKKQSDTEVQYIYTETGISSQFTIKQQPRSWQLLTDEQLLEQLAVIGKPAGLIWIDGKAFCYFGK